MSKRSSEYLQDELLVSDLKERFSTYMSKRSSEYLQDELLVSDLKERFITYMSKRSSEYLQDELLVSDLKERFKSNSEHSQPLAPLMSTNLANLSEASS
jgi:flagellar motor switch protein FliG